MSKSIILQSTTPAQQSLLDLATPINQAYATKFDFEYITDTVNYITDGRSLHWNKIGSLIHLLGNTDDGTLVVYMDADSFIIGIEDMHNILPSDSVFGMVPLRGGLGGRTIIRWYNSGVIAMINGPEIRQFFSNVWGRATDTGNDEDGLNAELKHNDLMIANKNVSSLDIKWNCWRNNIALCPSPNIRSFHGIKTTEAKLSAMTEFLSNK